MYQIDNSTAVATIPASTAAGTPGYFTDGNPATGVPATIMPAEYQNMLMMEIINVLAAAGITPSKSNFTQLLTAIKAVGRQGVILADTGTAGAYAAANTPALTALPASGYIQRINIANANPGASTYAPDGLAPKPIYGLGLQPLQGGELPVGVAVLMYLVQAGVNGGNGAWIIVESLGGASQVAPATKSQHSIQLAQMAAVVGGIRNGKMSVTAASATATFTADEVAVKSALGGSAWLLNNFSKTINLATTGAGGMDTGTAPVSGFIALYAIYNPATGVGALLATNATSVTPPEVYGGANMPAGYIASALVSTWPSSASGQFVAAYQIDRQISFSFATAATTSVGVGAPTAISVATLIPRNAKSCSGWATVATSGSSYASLNVSSSSTLIGLQQIAGASNGGSGTSSGSFSMVPLITMQTIYWSSTATGGTFTSASVYLSGYTF